MLPPLLALSLALPLTAAAAEPPTPNTQPEPPADAPALDWIRGCLRDTRSKTAVAECSGRWANACQTRHERMPTVGLTRCLADERDAWETLRLEVHERLLVAAASYDVHQRPGNPSVRDTLVAAKAAWEAFRKAQCDYEYAEYADGTMRGPVAVGCALRLTAARTGALLQHGWNQNHFQSVRDARVAPAAPARE